MLAPCIFLLPTMLSPPRLVLPSLRTARPIMSTEPEAILPGFPFVREADLDDSCEYQGFGIRLSGREACNKAFSSWKGQLPVRLRNFAVSDITVLPPDARSVISARYTVSFEAPVPPQVLPAQRARIASANLTRTADGRVPVKARIAVTILVDSKTGKVKRHTEALAVDPFAVTATIAHFEYVYARQLSLRIPQAVDESILARVVSYWATLRELTRQELDEIVRRSRPDELVVLEGADTGVTDSEFERWFTGFVVRNFLVGGAFGAALYYSSRALRELLN
jgi:hypothetical protein